jgi:uncharacterized surface protein with fasciclin (FAS1) repeats
MNGLNVIDTAITSGMFKTFTRLFEGSPLETVLRGREIFTLFAPLDLAFASMDSKDLSYLLRTQNSRRLEDVLGFHVVPGIIMSSDIICDKKFKTIYGPELYLRNTPALSVDTANLISPDIHATNGVVHGIDGLLQPDAT